MKPNLPQPPDGGPSVPAPKPLALDEKKTKMAVRLGWHEHTDKNGTYSGSHEVVKGWLRKRPGHSGTIIHDYEWKERWQLHENWDANTRKDILAVMTRAEKHAVCDAVAQRHASTHGRIEILELTQPDFFELAGQAMGLWEAE